MRKAQGGMSAAILVAIIAAVIVLYILFLPSEERMDLLNITEEKENGGEDEISENVLLLEYPREMVHFGEKIIEHNIDSVNLYIKKEDSVLKQVDSAYIKNGWFDKKTKDIDFKVELDKIDKIIISFNVKKHNGILTIKLNGNEIYNNEVTTANIEPITLPKEYLKEDNTLTLSVSGVGVNFWRTNEYILDKLKLIASIVDKGSMASENIFLISDEEKSLVKETSLRFSPECSIKEVGPLEILVNSRLIHSTVPDCGAYAKLEFSPIYLLSGENTLTFKTDNGHYLIDRILIRADLKETPSYVYYFDLTQEQLEDVEDGSKDVNLTFTFVDDEELKEATLYINGRKTNIPRTYDLVWSKELNSYVKEGSNSLKIKPEVTMEVAELRVEITD